MGGGNHAVAAGDEESSARHKVAAGGVIRTGTAEGTAWEHPGQPYSTEKDVA